MKNYQKYLLAAFLALFAPVFVSAQQNLLTQTTLSAAVAGSFLGQGVSSTTNPAPTLVQVASATGIVGLTPNLSITPSQPTQVAIYVDRELMYVVAVNGTALTVVRGANGTLAAPHASGAMVLAGQVRWFYTQDPGGPTAIGTGISHVPCTANNVVVSPWLNIRTGAQWLCSAVSSTWEPGWNNPLIGEYSGDFGTSAAATGAQTVPGPLFRLSGTNAITSFTIPLGFNATAVGSGSFCIIPSAAFTWTLTNNIASSGTAIIGKTLCFTWNAGISKFGSSY